MQIPVFKKLPSLFTFFPLLAGIVIAYYTSIDSKLIPLYYYYIALGILAVCSFILYSRLSEIRSLRFTLYFTAVMLFGFGSMNMSIQNNPKTDLIASTPEFKYSNVLIYGKAADDADETESRIKLIIQSDSITQGFKQFSFSGNVLTTIYKSTFGHDESPKISKGDLVRITGRIEDLPHRRNPGEFDYGEYLRLHDVDAVLYASGYDKIKVTGSTNPGWYYKYLLKPVKDYINFAIDKYSDGDEREFLRGLLIGDKSNLSKETKQDFINAGVAHIIAVSGLNVAYVLIVLSGLLLFIPIPKIYKNIILILALIFYMNLTGNSPSIIRASIMAIVFILAQFFERRANSYNVISFAAIVILVIDPRQLFDAGFILSFGSLLSIIYLYPKLNEAVNGIGWYKGLSDEKYYIKLFKLVIALFLGTLAAQLGMLPVTAIMFKKISVVSLVVNIFAIPVSNISLALGFVTVFVSLISGWAAGVFAAGNNFIMYYLLKSISYAARFDFSFVETYKVGMLLLVTYYSAILVLFTLKNMKAIIRLAIVILLAANYFVFDSYLSANPSAELSYFDAGNSNSTLISLPGGTNILINAGSSTKSYTSAERNILPYLKSKGIGAIDLLIATNMNANELRNITYLAEHFTVKKIMLPAYFKNVFDEKIVSEKFRNTQVEFIDSSKVINSKGKFRMYLYYDKILRAPSMLAKLVYGSQEFIFDDAEEEFEIQNNLRYLTLGKRPAALRVPLTGTFDESPSELIAGVNPFSIIISSERNRNNMVDSDVFEQSLLQNGFKVYNISKRGMLMLETDGNRTKVVDWK